LIGWIKDSWSGEEHLWKVFWIYGAGFIMLAQLVSELLWLFFSVDLSHPTRFQASQLFWIQLIYGIWLFVALWRCAYTAELRIWGHLLRTAIAIGVIYIGTLLWLAKGDLDLAKIPDATTRLVTILEKEWQAKYIGNLHDRSRP
jgi:hypothetical protein